LTASEIDLQVCEKEPIHQLGLVQPHGALVILERKRLTSESGDDVSGPPAYVLRHWSANLAPMCGAAGEQPTAGSDGLALLEACTDRRWGESLDRLVAAAPAWTDCGHLGPPGKQVSVWFTVHLTGSLVFVEIEPMDGAAIPGVSADIADSEIESALGWAGGAEVTNVYAFGSHLADVAAAWFGYDRVMVYRFHQDWSGEVIAEVRQPELPPLVGLRYPASDIPPQARQLYLTVPVRVIADVGAVPVPLIPPAHAVSTAPVDLSHCRLRSVSPYHIEYLRNMDVAATLVTSLIVDGRLWGLIACHHRTVRRVSPDLHRLAERVTAIAGRLIGSMLAHETAAQRRRIDGQLQRLTTCKGSLDDALRRLLFGSPRLTEVTRSLAGGIYADGVCATAGPTPGVAWIEALLRKLAARSADRCIALPSLAAWDAEFGGQESLASGFLVVFVSRSPLCAIFCVRPEVTREVLWGGDPSHPVEVDPVTGKISPRRSFRVWRQTVKGQARPWDDADIVYLSRLPEALGTIAGVSATELALAVRSRLEALEEQYENVDDLRADFLDAALEGMALTVAVDDRDVARTVSTNNAFREVFEFREDTVIGQPLPILLQQVGLSPDALSEMTEEPREVTAWSRTLGPRSILIHRRTMFVLRTQARQRTWGVLIFQDITGFRRVSDSLRAERDRAALSAQAKSQFLATVSHELRTPLNAIIGFSDLMRGRYSSVPMNPTEVARHAEHVYEAGRHLLGLIDDLLELSSRETGHRDLRETNFDLRALVKEICDWIEQHGATTGIAFARHLDGPPLPFRGEPKAIRQAIINILSNAFKFTDAGGTVTCRLGDLPDGTVIVVVKDTGIGMPAEKIDLAFKPFEQLDSGTNRQRGGIGLGLPLARSLIELHGGTINVGSAVGEGTTVTLALPAWRRDS